MFQIGLPRAGLDGAFLWAREAQGNGRAHLHVLVSRYLPWRKVQALWVRAGGGAAVFITRACDVHRVGGYLAKYLTGEKAASVPPGCRRFGASKGIVLWVKPPKERPSPWRLVDWELAALLAHLRREGVAAGAEEHDSPEDGGELKAFVAESAPLFALIPTFSFARGRGRYAA